MCSAPDESESAMGLVVNELGSFCGKISRGLESALEGDDGAEVERLAQQVRGCANLAVSVTLPGATERNLLFATHITFKLQ